MMADKAMKIFKKIENKKLFGKDLETFLDVLKYFTNKSEYAEDELYGWEKIVQVNLRDAENFYLKTDEPFAEHPKLAIEYGNVNSPDTTIITDGNTLTGIICGRTYSSMAKSEFFRIKGDNTQAGIFFMLLSLIGQEFAEQER
jgi:hypothetical protein